MRITGYELAQRILTTPVITDEKTLATAIQGVMDFFAASLTAKNETDLQHFKTWLEDESGKPVAWLIGQKQLATARQAALFNGFQAHYLDYDDVHAEVRGHPSAVVLSALFASLHLQKQTTLSSRRFLTAYIIGVEVMARFGKALNPAHYQQGWHSTSTLGGLGAVAAICYLHNYTFLDQAFALVSTQTSGLRLLFGTSIKPLHAGLAAQNAIQAIAWLQAGLTANKDFLASDIGFATVFHGKSDVAIDIEDWGKAWRIATPGLWFKTYPYCSAAAYVADSSQQIMQQHTFDVEDICQIELIFSPQGDTALIYSQPQYKQQGRFSAEYIVAKILSRETLDFSAFNQTKIEPHIGKLMQKMHRSYQPSEQRFAEVKVYLKNGQVLQHKTIHPKGSPQNPYANSELAQKLKQAINDEALALAFSQDLVQLSTEQNLMPFIQKYLYQL